MDEIRSRKVRKILRLEARAARLQARHGGLQLVHQADGVGQNRPQDPRGVRRRAGGRVAALYARKGTMLLSLPGPSSGLGVSGIGPNLHGTDFRNQRPTRWERRPGVPVKDSPGRPSSRGCAKALPGLRHRGGNVDKETIEAAIIRLVAEHGEHSDLCRLRDFIPAEREAFSSRQPGLSRLASDSHLIWAVSPIACAFHEEIVGAIRRSSRRRPARDSLVGRPSGARAELVSAGTAGWPPAGAALPGERRRRGIHPQGRATGSRPDDSRRRPARSGAEPAACRARRWACRCR